MGYKLQHHIQLLALTICAVFALMLFESPAFAADSLEAATKKLQTNNFKKKQTAVESIEAIDDPRVKSILEAMMNGNLYYRKTDKQLVFFDNAEGKLKVTGVLSGKEFSGIKKRDLRKVKTNNKLRKYLRGAIGRLGLGSENRDTRLAAAKESVKSLTPDSRQLIETAIAKEKDEEILALLRTSLALLDVQSDDQDKQIQAIKILAQSLQPESRTALTNLAQVKSVAQNESVKTALDQAIREVESKVDLYGKLEGIFFGISLGSVLLLAAIGLAITFGVMGVINMAHGEMMMLGAYTTYVVQLAMPNAIDMSLFIAIPAAFVVAGLVGIVIERGVIRYLYGRPLETLLATFGISLILQQAVRSIFSPLNRSVSTPEWMSGAWQVNGAFALTYNRMYIIIFSLLVFAVLVILLRKTSFGLQMRAVTQNRKMARAMGVRADWVDALTFGLGSGIAGIAGVALSQLTNVGPNLGQSYIIDSFMVVVFGGVGNLWGTLVGAMTLGVANKFLEPVTGSVLAKILVLVFIILFIQNRPRGLFALKGRAAEE